MPANPFASTWLRSTSDDAGRPPAGMSYVRGATDDPLKFMTIPALLDRAVLYHGARDAAVFAASGERLSWHDLKRRSDEVAAGLLALGVQRGDRVGIWAPNCVEWLLVQFGAARIGAILVAIAPALRITDLEHALDKVQCRVLVMAPGADSSDCVAALKQAAPELERASAAQPLRLLRFPALERVVLIGAAAAGMPSFKELSALAGPGHRSRLPGLGAALDPDDPVVIQLTRGTTGALAGATLSHYNVVNNARYAAKAMRLTEADRVCIPVPLHRSLGMVPGVLGCVARGAAMVFPATSFDPEATLRAVQQGRCTALHGLPDMFVAQLEHPRFARYDLSSLRTGLVAGAPCPAGVMHRLLSDMHMPEVSIAYGMTETGPVSFRTAADDPPDRRASTVGRVQPHIEAKVVDPLGRIVPPGTSGELCTRGYSTMLGYWDDSEQTAQAIDHAGWMHSGDLAVLDADGYCTIVGRVKDRPMRRADGSHDTTGHLHRHPKALQG